MTARVIATLLVGMLVTLVILLSPLVPARSAAQAPPPPVGQAAEPPEALIKDDSQLTTVSKAVYGDLKRSWFDWKTIEMEITIQRRTRASITSPWTEQVQSLTTSYYVLDVRSVCSPSLEISELFVAGVYPNGTGTIERWVFSPVQSAGSLPKPRRLVVYQGTELKRIRSIEPDPAGRFVLALSHETSTVYKLPLPSGTTETILTSVATPDLAGTGQIVRREHVSEGPQFHILYGARWEHDTSVPHNTIMIPDSNNDGVLEPHQVLTPQDYPARGYDQYTSWVHPCR